MLDVPCKRHSINTLMPFISVWSSLRPLGTRSDFLTLTKGLGQVGALASVGRFQSLPKAR